MSAPKHAKVGHVHYRIREEKGLGEATGNSGACGQDVQLIIYDPTLGEDQQRETLLHELLHAAVFAVGLHDFLKEVEEAAGVKDLEEKVINGQAGILLQILQDNPKIVKYLRGDGGDSV